MSEPELEPSIATTEIRPYAEGDASGILAGFRRVFPDSVRTDAAWRWQFLDNPAGLRIVVADAPGYGIVGQFAGIPRRVSIAGPGGRETRTFTEMVDSFTTPEARRGLRRPGLFARIVNRYVARFGHPDGDTLMYGLPNGEALPIGQRLLGYSSIVPFDALTASTEGATATPKGDAVLEERTEWPTDVDALWARCVDQHDASVVRDRRYLAWRWDARSGRSPRRFVLRGADGVLVALFVLSHAWNHRPNDPKVTLVAEWSADRTRPECLLLPEVIRGLARAVGDDRVRFHFRPGSPEWRHLAEVGWVVEPMGRVVVGGTYDARRVSLERLREGWTYTPGDFDIV